MCEAVAVAVGCGCCWCGVKSMEGSRSCMLGMVSRKVRPTAVTRSPWERAALTRERPRWPVAPKI